MSEDRGRADRPQLEDLVHRARVELRDWTDAADHDPGVALLELFAFVAELLGDYSAQVGSESYLGSGRPHSSARHRPGIGVGAPGRLCGFHGGTVLDDADPLGRSRLFVRVPDVAEQPLWAAACLPASGTTDVPGIGVDVWVAFESGDPSRPVWVGQRATA